MGEVVWNVRPADAGEVRAIASATGLPPVAARVMWLRGYRSVETVQRFLASRTSLDWLATPPMGPQFERAVARIKQAVAANEPFVIYGDYDCDGVTSSAVLYRYLKRGLGANCEAYLPDRFKDGYGVTAAAVERIADAGVKLILTCDNGISAVPAAEAAKRRGVEIVVTDHHQAPEVLPDVHAIVHPAVEFPHLKDLAGVGVALLFIAAMEGGFTPRLEYFLDVACIGTIGDVVALDGPNRPLVWAGIERYRAGKKRWPGLNALAEVAKTDLDGLRAEDVAFQLCPRLNAAGRLETPDVGFRLLTTNDAGEARLFADQLDAINKQRRDLSADLQAEIFARIDAEWDLAAEPFIVLADSAYHHGITGIIAGRVKDRYRVPVLLFSGHGEGAWKASGRSPEGVHLYEALHAARAHLLGFGGHAQAAGCSAEAGELAAVRQALNAYVREIGWTRPVDTVSLDAELPFAEADPTLLAALDRMEPFGQKNPAPIFGLMRARVVGVRVVKTHLFMNLDDGESVREVVAWGKAELADQIANGWVRLTYKPKYNTFRGETRIQLVADRLEPTTPPPPVAPRRAARQAAFALEDRRDQPPEIPADATIYARTAPAGHPGPWLGPLDPVPGQLGHVVFADPPRDLATLKAVAAAAERVTLAWPAEALEPPLTATGLDAVWRALAAQPEAALPAALRLAGIGDAWRTFEALAILQDAGMLVLAGASWHLLAPPGEAVDVGALATLEAVEAARRFRLEVAAAAPGRIRELALSPEVALA